MQENLELSLLKNILIIIRVVRWEVVETHVIFTRSGQARPSLHRAEVAELPGGGLEVVQGGGQSLLLVQLNCAVNILTSQEPSGFSCNNK